MLKLIPIIEMIKEPSIQISSGSRVQTGICEEIQLLQ